MNKDIYEHMLSLTYNRAREEYPSAGISTARKTITIKNTETVNSISQDSDIIIYYDLVSDTTPLLLVERLNSEEVEFEELDALVEYLNYRLKGYVAQAVKCENPKYYDVVVVKKNIYASVIEGD